MVAGPEPWRKKICGLNGGVEFGRGEGVAGGEFAVDGAQFGEAAAEHRSLFRQLVVAVRPESDFYVRRIALEEREHSQGVRDITDIFDLPAVAQQDARGALDGSRAAK